MWSYCLAAVGITGLWLAARHPRIGWWISIAAQGLWFAYGIATGQGGFLITAAVYTYVYARLLRHARPHPKTPDTPTNSLATPTNSLATSTNPEALHG